MHLKLKNALQWERNDGTPGYHVVCEMCLYPLCVPYITPDCRLADYF